MRTHADVTIAQAAQSLHIGSRRLFQILRERGVLSANNIAQRPYVDAGYLRNEHRSAFLTGTRIQRWYTVPLVTGKGMALLQELIDEVGAQGQVVVAERNAPHGQRSQGRQDAALQRLETTDRIPRPAPLARHHR